MNIVIPMAGDGKRFSDMGYTVPKPLIPVLNGQAMISAVIDNLFVKDAAYTFVLNRSQSQCPAIEELIKQKLHDASIVYTPETTGGPAMTALLASDHIDDQELVIVNCDQIINDFDISRLLEFVRVNNADGVLGAFISSSKKNSYMMLDPNGEVTDIKEKIVISNTATNGLHYWRCGLDFISSANAMIKNDERYNNEYYISPSYNYLIKAGKKILPYFYNLHFPIGTPEDLKEYQRQYANI